MNSIKITNMTILKSNKFRLIKYSNVKLYQVYQLGQELMNAEGGVILVLEMLLHLNSGNR